MDRMFLPTIHVRGSHYQVGYDVGKTFKGMIEDYVKSSPFLNEALLPAYNTSRGRAVYDYSLNLIKTKFPLYFRELEGTSDGSQVPFHLLMLLHMDDVILEDVKGSPPPHSENGCSSILCNQQDVVLGHTEDSPGFARNLTYIVHADITDIHPDGTIRHEKFTSFCHAGNLPGFCMNVNKHGFVFTMNLVDPVGIRPYKTPRHFLTRALLSVSNLDEAMTILRDSGSGTAHGFNVNMAFITKEDVPILFHTVEAGPSDETESKLSLLTVSPGETHVRCNSYLLLKIEENKTRNCFLSSTCRLRVMDRIGLPQTIDDVANLLSNDDDPDYPIYRQTTEKDDGVTLATGIFDLKQKIWKIYVDRAQASEPIAVLPLEI